MGYLKPAIRKRQKNVYNPVCHVCYATLEPVVTSNAQAKFVLNEHIRKVHYGLNL